MNIYEAMALETTPTFQLFSFTEYILNVLWTTEGENDTS